MITWSSPRCAALRTSRLLPPGGGFRACRGPGAGPTGTCQSARTIVASIRQSERRLRVPRYWPDRASIRYVTPATAPSGATILAMNPIPSRARAEDPWAATVPLDPSYLDYLGHVTAYRYLHLLEMAHTAWLSEITGAAEPSFVVAQVQIRFAHELVLADGPVMISVRPVHSSRRSVTVVEEIVSSSGRVHSRADAVLVNWDRDERRSLAFTAPELAAIRDQLRPAPR